jgi:hypothetical protein
MSVTKFEAQAELSRKAEGVMPRSLLWGFAPVIKFLWFMKACF